MATQQSERRRQRRRRHGDSARSHRESRPGGVLRSNRGARGSRRHRPNRGWRGRGVSSPAAKIRILRSEHGMADVLRRIGAGEDERTEFKRGLGDGSAVCRALCAFGNGDGGLIVLGVEDSGVIVGVRGNAERVQERLTDFLQTGCSVPISARCGRHEDPNGWVHWIEVPRQPRGFEPLHHGGRSGFGANEAVWSRLQANARSSSTTSGSC